VDAWVADDDVMLASLLRGTDPVLMAMAQALRQHALEHMPASVLRPTSPLPRATAQPKHVPNGTALLKPHAEPSVSSEPFARATVTAASHSQAAREPFELSGSSPDPSVLPTRIQLLRDSGIDAIIEHLKRTQLPSTEDSGLPSAASHLPALDAAPKLQYTAAGAEDEIAKLPVYSHRKQLLKQVIAVSPLLSAVSSVHPGNTRRTYCLRSIETFAARVARRSHLSPNLSPNPDANGTRRASQARRGAARAR
jgi:hypothetical protein